MNTQLLFFNGLWMQWKLLPAVQTAANALKQIEEKNYEADLIAAGIGRGQIYKRYCSEVNL
jgi:hypothetical protein